MSALFLEPARTVLFLSSSPHTFRLRMICSMVVLAPHEEVAKTFPVVRLATHKLIVSEDAVVRVELHVKTLAGKHMATVLPNFVLARNMQRLESCVTDFTGVNPRSLVLWSHPATTWFPSQTCPRHLQVQAPADEHSSSCAPYSWSLSWRWCSRWQSWSFGVPAT